MLRFRLRLIAAVLALVSIGLFASLLPRTSFVPRSSGELVDAIGPVWPGQSVEQALDDVVVISEVRIWAAAGFDRGEAPIAASLLLGADSEPVRQVKLRIRASKLLVPYVLVFPPYKPAPGEKLVLQLWVSTKGGQDNYVMFGASAPGTGIAPAISRQPTDYGPLAYELIWRGTGWRAALEGSISDLARLAAAVAIAAIAAAITAALHPRFSRALRKTIRRAPVALLALARPVQSKLRGVGRLTSRVQTPAARRGFYIFPWLIPAFAILHYLANNLLIFRVSDAIAVSVVTIAIATAVFVAFRLVFKTAAMAAVLAGLLGTACFSYGHVYLAVGDHADDRYLLGLGVPTVLGLGALIRGRPELARRLGTILNFGSLVLLAAPMYQIASHILAASSPPTNRDSQVSIGIDQHVGRAAESFSSDMLRDIYFIVLDEYPRSGSPEHFDNSAFVQELENRGFYVSPQARSNYVETSFSIPSFLNMRYVGQGNERGEQASRRLVEMADDHALGRILKSLGYKYVHVSSGYTTSNTSRNADMIVNFAPSGRLLSGPGTTDPFSFERATRLSSRFTDTFLRTTAAKPFLSHEFSAEHDGPYRWTHPFRTLAWLDFMKEIGTMERPKFVFAHLLKPHAPYSFDRYGNITFDIQGGWRDDHDPTVPGAFYGQVIWLNGQMLEVIDAILDGYEEPPIIVIVGDHGHERNTPSISNDILAAFLLPDGGASAVYPSITSVNHFRAILDHYFGLDLGLLEDRVYNSGG